jgi:hypothetical protein
MSHLTEYLLANEQDLAISVKKQYDDPYKCCSSDQDAGFFRTTLGRDDLSPHLQKYLPYI